MSIKDIYKNLDSDIKNIVKSKRTNKSDDLILESLQKSNKRFDENDINHIFGNEAYAYDNEYTSQPFISTESFTSCINESQNYAGQRGIIAPIEDRANIATLRHTFGREMITERPEIGCHPDFKHLENENSTPETGYTVTLFLDIIGSTKLGVNYPPTSVFRFKNNVITGAIETITAFDGHVHRIMGDAVMAFFRSKKNESNNSIKNSAIDAINCASYFIEVMDKIVLPQIESDGLDDIGIRIGIDIGNKDWVLWSNYGIPGINEVTATSFFVDIASKLQHNAPKNSIMLGQQICEELGIIGSPFIRKKTKKEHGEKVNDPYVINVTSNGRTLRYKQYIFNHEEYFKHLPHGEQKSPIQVNTFIGDTQYDSNAIGHLPCSSLIRRGKWIKFMASHPLTMDIDNLRKGKNLHFLFSVENTGAEASKVDNYGNHKTPVTAIVSNGVITATQWEHANYNGLHYMRVSLFIDEKEIIPARQVVLFISE